MGRRHGALGTFAVDHVLGNLWSRPQLSRRDRSLIVVTFLAMLELAREQLVSVAQAEPYAPIYVQLKGEPAFALAADDE